MKINHTILLISLLSGSTTYSGLQHWYSPHQIAVTGAGGAVSTITADVLNPAGLWNQPRQLSVSSITYPADIAAQSLHLVLPGVNVVRAYSIRYLNYGLFDGRDELNQETDQYIAADTWLNWAAAGQSRKWPLSWGLSSGLFYSALDDKQSILLTFSCGLIMTSSVLDTKLGLSLVHAGVVLESYTGYKESLPTVIVASFAKEMAYLPLTIAVDIEKPLEQNRVTTRFGGIFTLPHNWQIKLGTTSNKIAQSISENVAKNIFIDTGAGISWAYARYSFEYSLYLYGPGGWISGVAISIRF